MKKVFLSAALLAAITMTSCSETKTQDAEATMEHHEGMDHSNMAKEQMPMKEVVETPDFTANAEPVKAEIALLVDNYLKLKEALVAANVESAKTEAQAILAAADKVDVAALEGEQKAFAEEKLEEVKQSASKIAEANETGAQRENLEMLSEATFSLTKAFDATEQTLYYQHCPMANNSQGAYWLSSDQEIRNPYFGEKMLHCGSTEEVLN